MTTKKSKTPTFTVQCKLVVVLDVEVEAPTLEEAIAIGKSWSREDLVTLDDSATEYDSKTTVVGAYSQKAWSVE